MNDDAEILMTNPIGQLQFTAAVASRKGCSTGSCTANAVTDAFGGYGLGWCLTDAVDGVWPLCKGMSVQPTHQQHADW